jgi:hypothetical protein
MNIEDKKKTEAVVAGQMVAVRALEAGQAALPRWTWCWWAGPGEAVAGGTQRIPTFW